jgi:hypothetical protein
VRYFVPDIRAAAELGPQVESADKFGGLPWGLPARFWPRCKACGGSQSLLAELHHHPQRINLGRADRVLFVFQCNHDPGMCATWEADSGANACLVLERDQLEVGLTSAPEDNPLEEHELRVVQWIERDDGLSEELRASFFDQERYFALPRDVQQAVTSGTRLGGVPKWVQNPSEAPPHSDRWRFIGQLDSGHSFLRPPAVDVGWISVDPDNWEGRTHFGEGPNFGDGGIAYLFIRVAEPVVEGRFMWQCG